MTKTVTVNDNAYQMSDELAETTIQMAKDALKGTNAIYALVKGNFVQMVKFTYPSRKSLHTAVRGYISKKIQAKHIAEGPE